MEQPSGTQQSALSGSLTNKRQQALEHICRRVGLQALYVFGSRTQEVWKWLQGERQQLASGPSDVDVGVKLPPQVTWTVRQKVELAIALEDFFECSRVDLVGLDEADPFVAVEIIRGERLFAQDDYLADEYDLYVLRRAGDLAPLERERQALILGEFE